MKGLHQIKITIYTQIKLAYLFITILVTILDYHITDIFINTNTHAILIYWNTNIFLILTIRILRFMVVNSHQFTDVQMYVTYE